MSAHQTKTAKKNYFSDEQITLMKKQITIHTIKTAAVSIAITVAGVVALELVKAAADSKSTEN
jgi:hypothetical protein